MNNQSKIENMSEFKKGEPLTLALVAKKTGMSKSLARQVMLSMVDGGTLDVNDTRVRGKRHQKYRRKTNAWSFPKRRYSNAQLGITESPQFGVPV